MLAPKFERKNQMVFVIFISYHIHVIVGIQIKLKRETDYA